MKPKPLSAKTRTWEDKTAPPDGRCGGRGIWNLVPRRHWCRMSDAEVAVHVLAGEPIYDKWDTIETDNKTDKAWIYGTLVLRSKHDQLTRQGRLLTVYERVRLNTQCPWEADAGGERSHDP